MEQEPGMLSLEMSIKGEGHSQTPVFSSDSEDFGVASCLYWGAAVWESGRQGV